ncbi:pectate lyase [bacterium]|nr:pectate lyase [bacterium]
MRIIFTLCFFVYSFDGVAKKCTETDIRNAVNSKKTFDFDAENCSDDIIYISKGIALNGGVVIDGRNKMRLSWKGEGSQCDEIPRGDAYATFYTNGNKNVIKNLTILLSPEGIHLGKGKDNIVDGVTFERICEDAITNGNKQTSSATGSIIRNSVFKNGPDKAIQCNGGSMTVQNSVFRDIPRAIGACTYKADPGNHVAKECPIVCNIKAYNNKVYGCRGYGFRGAGYLQKKKQGTLTAIGNHFEGCKTPIMSSQYGYVYAEDNTAKGSCDQFANTEQNGRGDMCGNDTSACKRNFKGSFKNRCIAQNPVPSPEPPPSENPGEGSVLYSGQGVGGTEKDMSRSEQEKLACSRAEDRALVNARSRCSSEGKIVEQSSSCDSCKSTSKGVSCNGSAKVTCDYSGGEAAPSPEPRPEPEKPSFQTFSADGKGGTTKGDKSKACDLAKGRALDAAEGKCSGNVVSKTTSSCSYKKRSSKNYTAYTSASVKCEI